MWRGVFFLSSRHLFFFLNAPFLFMPSRTCDAPACSSPYRSHLLTFPPQLMPASPVPVRKKPFVVVAVRHSLYQPLNRAFIFAQLKKAVQTAQRRSSERWALQTRFPLLPLPPPPRYTVLTPPFALQAPLVELWACVWCAWLCGDLQLPPPPPSPAPPRACGVRRGSSWLPACSPVTWTSAVCARSLPGEADRRVANSRWDFSASKTVKNGLCGKIFTLGKLSFFFPYESNFFYWYFC